MNGTIIDQTVGKSSLLLDKESFFGLPKTLLDSINSFLHDLFGSATWVIILAFCILVAYYWKRHYRAGTVVFILWAVILYAVLRSIGVG